jgi:hypothetical protein
MQGLYPAGSWVSTAASNSSTFFFFLACFREVLIDLQEWNGQFWVAVTLAGLGLVYQLGHGGQPCPRPAPTDRTMVVMDTEYIHTVKYRFCGCDRSDRAGNLEQLLRSGWYPATTVDPATCATFASLELFRLLNVVGNINVHDFVGTLERQTSAAEMKSVPVSWASNAFDCRLIYTSRIVIRRSAV